MITPITLKGKYGEAKIYAKTIENDLISQCIELLNQPMTKNSQIRIMPDTHAGKGCMIGTTMKIENNLCPNLVGVDIGCGMLTVSIGKEELDFDKLDDIITKYVPLGFESHPEMTKDAEDFFKNRKVIAEIDYNIPKRALGTLGGGNHFIEIDEENNGEKYLIIHTGSRNFGKQIAEYWQGIAIEEMVKPNLIDIPKQIEELKAQKRFREIESMIKESKIKNKQALENVPNKDLATISGENLKGYLRDAKIAQEYAALNRKLIAHAILSNYFGKDLDEFEYFETIHNYIDIKEMMLRKGAISAKLGEKVLIPLNMRDGSLIAIGKGNSEWNNSAPHGTGRLISRSKAKDSINLEDFKENMKGIHSISVNESTLDESPFAYKNAEEIIDCVKDTVDIIKHIKPIYNRKA